MLVQEPEPTKQLIPCGERTRRIQKHDRLRRYQNVLHPPKGYIHKENLIEQHEVEAVTHLQKVTLVLFG